MLANKALIHKLKPKPRMLARVFAVSISIISLVGFGLAYFMISQYEQKAYNQQTAELIADIPSIVALLQHNQLLPKDGNWLQENLADTDYIIATCSSDYQQVWTSKIATQRGLTDACRRFKSLAHQPPYFTQLNDGLNYFIFLLPVELRDTSYRVLILKDTHVLEQQYDDYVKATLVQLLVILAITIGFLAAAAYWGTKPIGRMQRQLQSITHGKRSQLSQDYPAELEGVTQALNQLLQQSSSQTERYQNAINDLAHSLKTRLAAVHALMSDEQLTRKDLYDRVMDQVGQMDLLVKYQLKRAMLGRQGLQQETTLIKEVAVQITNMLDKVYQEKRVQLSLHIDENCTFPGDKGDLMELIGNMLENAYRLSISQVRLTAYVREQLLHILIEDDGPGVDPAMRSKILQRGVRADTKTPGQGIGLAVCAEIINSYGGQLTIDDSDLEGAKFEIKLPLN
ncbi:ATP-binding protein [Paraferrimonas sp. SM1919]|uniref:ATP-binding protein n=1 Tax=Paraferrimonas sp. SM1919 TaxID=2662263 RepID=UPI0013D241F1|nr:ATP-binding protein [Paraferrimonas sp. SM1919]